MKTTEVEKVLSTLAAVSAGDAERATRDFDQAQFIQHNPRVADGTESLRQFIQSAPREQLHMTVVRAFQDGPMVVTQATGKRSGHSVFFDVFRFDNDLIVEHWAFSAPDAPPNRSGHTQVDGPTETSDRHKTTANKAFMRRYYETFHIAGHHDNPQQYFKGNICVRHEPGVRDGADEFLRDVEVLMRRRTIDEIKFLIGEGDFVFIAAKGTHEGEPSVYVDLYRVEDEKIVEHWGFPETIPPPTDWKNNNGML